MKLKLLLSFFTLALLSNTMWALPHGEIKAKEAKSKIEVASATSKALTKAEIKDIKRAERQQARFEKRIAFVQKVMKKKYDAGIDFQDPVNKWMWFWIFGWGAGLLLSIIGAATLFSTGGFIWILGSLCWLFGTVSLVIWLVKKFG